MSVPNATRDAARAAVQAWLEAQMEAWLRVEGASETAISWEEYLAPRVLRLAERCAREGVQSYIGGEEYTRLAEPEWLAAVIGRALTAEDRGTDG